MNRKLMLLLALVSLLLVAILSGVKLVSVAKANPYMRQDVFEGEVSPPVGTKPPIVSIIFPTNDTAYSSKYVSLTFNVSLPSLSKDDLRISEIYYQASWWQYSSIPIGLDGLHISNSYNNTSLFSINMTGLGEGPRTLRVYAIAEGFREGRHAITQGYFYTTYYHSFKIAGSSTVNFTIDTAPPSITNLSAENKTYNSSYVPLSFNVNEETPQLSYSLDNQENVTLPGNTTLSSVIDGTHSVVVYANDSAGNVGSSNVVFFTINTKPSPSPTSSPSNSPNQQPTPEPTQSAQPTAVPAIVDGVNPNLGIIAAAIVVLAIVGLAAYFTKFSKKKTRVQKEDAE